MGQSQKFLSLLKLPLFACYANLSADASVGRVVLSFVTLGVLRNELGFDKVVELVQIGSKGSASLHC